MLVVKHFRFMMRWSNFWAEGHQSKPLQTLVSSASSTQGINKLIKFEYVLLIYLYYNNNNINNICIDIIVGQTQEETGTQFETEAEAVVETTLEEEMIDEPAPNIVPPNNTAPAKKRTTGGQYYALFQTVLANELIIKKYCLFVYF